MHVSSFSNACRNPFATTWNHSDDDLASSRSTINIIAHILAALLHPGLQIALHSRLVRFPPSERNTVHKHLLDLGR